MSLEIKSEKCSKNTQPPTLATSGSAKSDLYCSSF